MRRFVVTLITGLVGVGLAGCGSGGSDSGSTGTASTSHSASASPSLSGDLTVFAAASLKDSFTDLGKQFEAAHPGVKVTFSFAASSALAAQITSGAPADVFASASTKNMDKVAAAATAPKVFAKNVMEIAVPPSNPGKVTGPNSLASPSVKTALCQPQVPCGATAAKVFTNAKITVKPVTLEPDVKAVLSKVQLGEVDAGVVYVTDVLAAGAKVKGVEIPADVNASTSYPIAALTKSANAKAASAFVDYVLSPTGGGVLTAAGFQKP
ncbi:MAG: molybdate transport system substrate-binding protein [Kribbellaceae bacterium]|nr:molybdate transport system substrate-binding protein [Kribbellaceae bacterium]